MKTRVSLYSSSPILWWKLTNNRVSVCHRLTMLHSIPEVMEPDILERKPVEAPCGGVSLYALLYVWLHGHSRQLQHVWRAVHRCTGLGQLLRDFFWLYTATQASASFLWSMFGSSTCWASCNMSEGWCIAALVSAEFRQEKGPTHPPFAPAATYRVAVCHPLGFTAVDAGGRRGAVHAPIPQWKPTEAHVAVRRSSNTLQRTPEVVEPDMFQWKPAEARVAMYRLVTALQSVPEVLGREMGRSRLCSGRPARLQRRASSSPRACRHRQAGASIDLSRAIVLSAPLCGLVFAAGAGGTWLQTRVLCS